MFFQLIVLLNAVNFSFPLFHEVFISFSLFGTQVTMVGDLKNGRTVHSLAKLLCLYNVTLRYVSPAALCMPDSVKEYVGQKGIHQVSCRFKEC